MMERKPTAAATAIGLPSHAEIAQVALDPELFSYMLEDLAEVVAASSRKRPGVIDAAVLSYCDFHGLDPDGVIEPPAMLEMAALASRLSTLMDLSEAIPKSGNPERYRAIAEAACTARLIDKEGKPAFQFLDFLAALGRAEARL